MHTGRSHCTYMFYSRPSLRSSSVIVEHACLYDRIGVCTRRVPLRIQRHNGAGYKRQNRVYYNKKKKNRCRRRDDNENTDHGYTCCGLKFSRSRFRFNFLSPALVVFCPESRFLFFFSFSSSSYYYYYFGRSLLVPPPPPPRRRY